MEGLTDYIIKTQITKGRKLQAEAHENLEFDRQCLDLMRLGLKEKPHQLLVVEKFEKNYEQRKSAIKEGDELFKILEKEFGGKYG